MNELLQAFKVKVNSGIYLKDPDTSAIGRAMVREGLVMMESIGLDQFTFKKLSEQIGSPESSLYRYFENKVNLLFYLLSAYWSWQEYRVVMSVLNMAPGKKKVHKAIEVILSTPDEQAQLDELPLAVLYRLAERESIRVFVQNNAAHAFPPEFFHSFDRLHGRFVTMLKEINPDYSCSEALISVLLDAIHLQKYFRRAGTTRTDLPDGTPEQADFFFHLLFPRPSSHHD